VSITAREEMLGRREWTSDRVGTADACAEPVVGWRIRTATSCPSLNMKQAAAVAMVTLSRTEMLHQVKENR